MSATPTPVRRAASIPVTGERAQASDATRALVLATFAFTACFYAWSIIGPARPRRCRSTCRPLRVPDRASWSPSRSCSARSCASRSACSPTVYGGRRVFSALMAFSILPARRARRLARLARDRHRARASLLGVAGASFAVGVVFVNGWYPPRAPRLRARRLRHGNGRHRPRRAHRAAHRRPLGLQAPFLVAAGVLVARHGVVFAIMARDAAEPRPANRRAVARRSARDLPRPPPGLGADALLLPVLRRLRRDVPLPAQAAASASTT